MTRWTKHVPSLEIDVSAGLGRRRVALREARDGNVPGAVCTSEEVNSFHLLLCGPIESGRLRGGKPDRILEWRDEMRCQIRFRVESRQYIW